MYVSSVGMCDVAQDDESNQIEFEQHKDRLRQVQSFCSDVQARDAADPADEDVQHRQVE